MNSLKALLQIASAL